MTFVEAHPESTAMAKKIDIVRLRVIIANLLLRLALALATFGRELRDFSGKDRHAEIARLNALHHA